MALWGDSTATHMPYPEYIECTHCGAFTRNYLVACTYCHEMLVLADAAVAPLDTALNLSANLNIMDVGSDLVQEFTMQFERYPPATYGHIDWLTAVFLPTLVSQHAVHTQTQYTERAERQTRVRDWIDTGQEDTWIQWPRSARTVELVMDDEETDTMEYDPVLIGGGLLDSARHLFVTRVAMERGINGIGEGNGEGVQCAVCLEELQEGLQLVCEHVFHDTCISPWFEQHDTCPTCRDSLNKRMHMLLHEA